MFDKKIDTLEQFKILCVVALLSDGVFSLQERMCADSGAYMANLKSCANCKGNQLKIVNKIVVLESEVEITTYERKIGLLLWIFFSIAFC